MTDQWREPVGAQASARRCARGCLGDRSRQCRGGGARHRGRAARSARNERQDRGTGHARPRARAARPRRARTLEGRGRRFRRRCARRHAAGVFARLVAEAALGGLAPVTLLALLKHPLARLGAGVGAHHHAISTLEQALLRGPRPKPGTAGLQHALATFRANFRKLHRADPRARLTPGQLQNAADLVDALLPLRSRRSKASPGPGSRCRSSPKPIARAIEALSRERRGDGTAFIGPDGTQLAEAFDDIADNARDAGAVSAQDYPDLFRTIIAEKPVRRPDRPGVRVRIYGLLEARLQHIDRVVLGGLVEGVWPPETRSDPWLSRPMRRRARARPAGAAHLAQRPRLRAGARRRAKSCSPIPPSSAARRRCRRASCSGWRRSRARRAGMRRCSAASNISPGRASSIDPTPSREPIKRPEPKPARDARPTSLSVTEIETWLRDPYSIYARHILRLAAARCGRHAARRARPRHRDP